MTEENGIRKTKIVILGCSLTGRTVLMGQDAQYGIAPHIKDEAPDMAAAMIIAKRMAIQHENLHVVVIDSDVELDVQKVLDAMFKEPLPLEELTLKLTPVEHPVIISNEDKELRYKKEQDKLRRRHHRKW